MNSDPASPHVNWAAELLNLVNKAFDTNEMNELTYDFKLDYDDISGQSKSAKTIEFIQLLSRQQRIPELIERCQELRPKENWQPLLEAARAEPLSFAVDPVASETSPTSPSPLQNKNLLIGIAAVVLIVVVAVVLLNGRASISNFNGDKGLLAKIGSLLSNPDPQRQLLFEQGTPGWLLTSQSAVLSEDGLQMGANSFLVRDKTFGPGQGILLDFVLSEVSSTEPVVTFSLQNAANREDATRIISLQALTQPTSTAVENGESMAADQFARNTTLMANTDYTVVMGFDGNGRFLASLFGISVGTTQDAKFIYAPPEDWANETWWFHIDTGNQGDVTLFGGWEFNFDAVK